MTPDEFKACFKDLQGIKDEDIGVLLGTLEVKRYKAGTDVIAPGEHNSVLHLIHRGRLRVSLESVDECTVLGDFGPGQWVGEMGMIEPATSAAQVIAIEDSDVLRLSHEAFMALRRSNLELTSVLLTVISASLAERLRATINLVDSGRAGAEPAHTGRDWITEVARRLMGIAARVGA